MGKLIDLTGMRFGRLTVLERGEDYINPKGQKVPRWICKCDCGNTKLIRGREMRIGSIKSCGCLRKELAGRGRSKPNKYEFHDNYVIGYLFCNISFIIDSEEYEKVKKYKWHKGSKEGYIKAYDNVTKKSILLHRMIMNAPEGVFVDHINHDLTDNRKCNLRLVTFSQNQMNKRQFHVSNSGVTGVHMDQKKGKWIAYIKVNRNSKYLGSYDSFDDAVKARKDAEEQYFGEYSYDKSIAAVPRITV